MRLLVLGCNGQLGRCLSDRLLGLDHEVILTSRKEIDISNIERTRDQILEVRADVVINATAYTAVDKAEEDPETADLINHLSVANIAGACEEAGSWLVHVSTDYVFDGRSDIPFRETDQPNPQSVYGLTKLRGEEAIKLSGCKHVIVRTAWVFSEYGGNFLKTMLRLGRVHEELSIVADQIGCPTYAGDVADAIIVMLTNLNAQRSGVFHYTGAKALSWHAFATVIFSYAAMYKFKVPRAVKPITTAEYPTQAERPTFSVLDCSKIRKEFGVSLSDWEGGIDKVMRRLVDQSIEGVL